MMQDDTMSIVSVLADLLANLDDAHELRMKAALLFGAIEEESDAKANPGSPSLPDL